MKVDCMYFLACKRADPCSYRKHGFTWLSMQNSTCSPYKNRVNFRIFYFIDRLRRWKSMVSLSVLRPFVQFDNIVRLEGRPVILLIIILSLLDSCVLVTIILFISILLCLVILCLILPFLKMG